MFLFNLAIESNDMSLRNLKEYFSSYKFDVLQSYHPVYSGK